ncbi:hypothetical protein [Micromonospora sp. ATCC 39149]|nr:hypothetical protein [Micromonospora sp. ATCC 39149]
MGINVRWSVLRAGAAVTLAAALGVGSAHAHAQDGTESGINHALPLADAATELITNLDLIGWPDESAYNFYSDTGATTTIVFGTPGVGTSYRNETQCATFVRRLMTHSSSWATDSYFTTEFASKFPNSAKFFDAFAADRDGTNDVPKMRGFDLSFLIYMTLQPGDIMAIKYVGATTGGSGHMAIIGPGSRLISDSHPDYKEWAIRVMDSTDSPHGDPADQRGFGDTRFYDHPTDGWQEADGAGMGWMFIRTSKATGRIIAHKWSVIGNDWHDMTTRPVIFGRIDPYA